MNFRTNFLTLSPTFNAGLDQPLELLHLPSHLAIQAKPSCVENLGIDYSEDPRNKHSLPTFSQTPAEAFIEMRFPDLMSVLVVDIGMFGVCISRPNNGVYQLSDFSSIILDFVI